VSGGELLVDGVNIKDYSLHSLRSQMSIVTQEPILFNDTIANNISLGMTNATDEEIIRAAKIANAHDFIMQKEEGYDTNIGDRGSKLSGGERQRITIARAVLKNPPILILDEATSSLDTGKRTPGAGCHQQHDAKPHQHRHRPPAEHHPPRQRDHRAAKRENCGARHPRRTDGAGRRVLPEISGNAGSEINVKNVEM